ncbi:hypothetical protein [Falsiroseomonas ponticola]|jgi:hypothetical protein|uniref:hypothetical protein n=1 Tax=Falsiroseomonas ponticola TaxID=2786951 RepID=UPI001934AF63|nr:hypothetical protein [Roseomonas ponticola]
MPNPTSPNERPENTPDRNIEKGVVDSFPASDAPAGTATQGARAVPPAAMMGSAAAPEADAVTLARHFPDAESAKLALENLVRAVPLDRHCTAIEGLELRLTVARADAGRVEDMLMSV